MNKFLRRVLLSELKEILESDILNEDGLTHKEATFLVLLFDECAGNVRMAMDMAGYPKGTPQSHVTKKLQKHIQERTKEYIVSSTAKAAISVNSVLENPNTPGSKTLLDAAKQVLDRGGIIKEEAVQVTEIRNMFILPAKNKDEEDDE